MKVILLLVIFYVACLPLSLNAAPLNKFGTMQQQMAVPQLQQAALPPPVQQQAVVDRSPLPAQPNPVVQKEKDSAVLNEVEKLLSRLPLDKLQQWQTKFEDKRNEAEKNGKTNVMKYYDRLIILSEKLKNNGVNP